MLSKGQRGEEVKNLQEMLRQAGFFKHATNTGYFGDITEKALKDFQAKRGLKQDGVYGVASSNALENNANIQKLLNNPNHTPETKNAFMDLYASGDTRLSALAGVAPNVVITPEEIAKTASLEAGKLLNQRRAADETKYDDIYAAERLKTDPYYTSVKNRDTSLFNNSISTDTNNYNNSIENLNNRLTDDSRNFYDKEANMGIFNGGRAERLKSLQNGYNSQAQSLFNNAQDNLFKTRTSQAYNMGDDAALANNDGLQQFKFNPVQNNTGQSAFGAADGGKYNPFNFRGQYNLDQSANAEMAAKRLLNPDRVIN